MSINSNTVGTVKAPTFSGRVDFTFIKQTADAQGNEELVAAVPDRFHYLEKIRVDMAPGSTARSFTINSNTTAKIGPVDLIDGGGPFEYTFLRPLQFGKGEAIRLDTEADDQIHVIGEGFTAVD